MLFRSVGEVVVPLGRRQLAGDDRRAGRIAILQDFEEVAALLLLGGGEGPIIDDEHIETGQLGQQADVGAIGPRQGEFVKEARGAAVPAPTLSV